MDPKIKETVKIFKENSVYYKLFIEFKKKYESLGRIGGTVSLAAYSEDEIDEISRFFGLRSDVLMKKKSVTLLQFEKQLKKYKGESLSLELLLESYFGQALVSNKERIENKAIKQWYYFDRLKSVYSVISIWLEYVELKSADSYWIYKIIDDSDEVFESYVKVLNQVIESLPKNPIRLPVFAQKITGNPHAFDRNQSLGRLLIHLLAVNISLKKGESVSIPSSSEEISELLLRYNILKDDITNYISIANLLAKTHDEKEIVWKSASDTSSVLNVPIRELLTVKELYPAREFQDVWIVENSGVFSSLLDEVPTIPLICTHGQFKLSAWKCFDLLVKSESKLHYASDLDPEGLGMADRLLNRYPGSVSLWKMDIQSYEKSILKEDKMSNARLNQLTNITNPILNDIKNLIFQQESPGYQEALLDEMVEELKHRVREN